MDIQPQIFCLTPKTGALIVSIIDLVFGFAGTTYFILHSLNFVNQIQPDLFLSLSGGNGNHALVLSPRTNATVNVTRDVLTNNETNVVYYYEVSKKEILMVLYLYFLFILTVFLLGIILTAAALNENSILAKVSIILSLLNIFGTVAGIIGLFIANVHWFLVVPIFIAIVCQVYFFWIIYDFHRVCCYSQAPNHKPGPRLSEAELNLPNHQDEDQ